MSIFMSRSAHFGSGLSLNNVSKTSLFLCADVDTLNRDVVGSMVQL